MQLKARYIDGKTSKKWDCTVSLGLDEIIVSYKEEFSRTKTSIWKLPDILRLDLISSNRTLKYGDFPHEVLEFHTDEDFKSVLNHYPEAEFTKSLYNRFHASGWKGMIIAMVGVILFSLFFFFYGAPFIAEVFARNIPAEYETYIGENIRETYLYYFTVDTAKSEEIQRFYDNLNYTSEWDVSVVYVETSQANAFALPGGYIVVFSGILDLMENEDELAALLAHEVSHINGRHSLRTVSRQLSMYLVLAVLTGDVGGFSSVLIENSELMSSLSYSRKFEKEADLEGMNLMIESQIDPYAMVSLFEKLKSSSDSLKSKVAHEIGMDSLKKQEADTSQSWEDNAWTRISEVMSTHPSPENRIGYLNERISELGDPSGYPSNQSLSESFNRLRTKK